VHLLLADDRPKTRFALRTLLRLQTGLVVVGEAASADELLELAEQTLPDIVLLSWGLRGFQSAGWFPSL